MAATVHKNSSATIQPIQRDSATISAALVRLNMHRIANKGAQKVRPAATTPLSQECETENRHAAAVTAI